MQLTNEQDMAINLSNKNLLVSASAGSGKTFVMVKRIASLLKTVDVDELLVVTFTKAAAGEMKNKLIDELEKQENKDDRTKRQLQDIATANICTLHSFCAKLLKSYFYELGLDPSFIVIDDKEEQSLKDKAVQMLFDECFDSFNKEFFEIADILSKNRKDDSFKKTLLKLYDFLNVQPDGEKFFCNALNCSFNENYNENVVLLKSNDIILNQMLPLKEKGSILLENANASGDSKLISVMQNIVNFLNGFDEKNDLHATLSALNSETNFGNKPSKVGAEYEFLCEDIGEFKNDLNKIIKDYKENLELDFDFSIEQMKDTKQKILYLYNLVVRFGEIYSLLKKDRASLDFSDLEHLTLKLLSNCDIRESIKSKIKYVFVDEYQDTNLVQESILQLLSGERNVFLVGDVKQSIYSFRLCDPQIFIDKAILFNNNPQSCKNIYLNKNFRSRKEILDFVNTVFDRVMTQDFGGVDYKNQARLEKGAVEFKNSSDFPAVAIDIIQKSKSDKPILSRDVYSVQNHINENKISSSRGVKEGCVICNRILSMVGNYLFDSKLGRERKIKYSDIVILVSSRDDNLKDICNELSLAKIPFSTDIKEDIFDDESLMLIKNLLIIINNPKLDIELLGVLSSHVFDFSFEDFATIKKCVPDGYFFYEKIEAFVQDSKFAGELQNKLKKFYDFIEKYNFMSRFLTVSDIISRIADETAFELYSYFLDDGNKKVQKFNKLLESLNGKSYNNNLAKYVLEFVDVPSLFETVASPNSVKITTIHKSKGLEYPIVILPLIEKLFNREDLNKDILFHNNYGVVMNYFDLALRSKFSTLPMFVAKNDAEFNLACEKQRLLYVALTRAVNHLFIVGYEDKPLEDKKLKNYSDANCFKDFLNRLFLLKQSHSLSDDENNWDLNYINEGDIENIQVIKQDRHILFTKNNEKLKNAFNDYFKFHYPCLEATKSPLKTSVTAVLQKERDNNVYYSLPKEDVKTANIGIVYHKILQLLDFKKRTLEQIKCQIDNLVAVGEISNEDMLMINADDFYTFLNSDFINYLFNQNYLIYKEQEFVAGFDYCDIFNESNLKDKIIIQGVCDLVAIKDDNMIIVDYKISGLKSVQKYIDNYSKQLNLYALAMKSNFNVTSCKKYIYAVNLKQFIEII